jgi:hypothetical protein
VSLNDLHTGPEPEDDETGDPLSGWELAADLQADLSELRGLTMGLARKIAARADTEDGQDELVRLNAAVAKAARAVRQIAVLQLEIDGQRTLPGSRGANVAGNGAANQNAAGQGGKRGPNDRTYGDYRDYTDEDRAERRKMEEWENAQFAILGPAMDADLRAAGHDYVLNQSLMTKSRKLIPAIPHPAVDDILKSLDYEFIYALWGEENLLPPTLGPGPPDALAEFAKYAEHRRRGRGETSNS